jgi:acid phosphatase (class B)
MIKGAISALILVVLGFSTLSSAEHRGAAYITLAALEKSLPKTPIVAGFDVDDTVLFSSPGFYFGAYNTDGPNGANRYGDKFLENPQFWKDLNQYYDRYSMKKKAGDDLLQMHKRRGDTIVFITKRFCYDDDAQAIEKRLAAAFKVASKVYCTNEGTKTPTITATGVDVYYGDSDSDIEYSLSVTNKKVRPVRVERSKLSTNLGGYHPGKYGEEVLAGSEN